MCDIIPKTSENRAPPNGALGVVWRDMWTAVTRRVLLRGHIREGRTPTAPNVRAHLTINLSKLPSAPGAVLCADICPASVRCQGSVCGDSSSDTGTL